jgi:hypothetical protein
MARVYSIRLCRSFTNQWQTEVASAAAYRLGQNSKGAEERSV